MAKAKTIFEAIEQLVKAGYPESTAKKIATGELPMDFTSRMNRAREQGFRTEAYHTGDPNILEFDPEKAVGERSGSGTWFSENPAIASSYADKDSATYKVLLNTDDFGKAELNTGVWSNVGPFEYVTKTGKSFDSQLIDDPFIMTTNELARFGKDQGDAGVIIDGLIDMGPNYKSMDKSLKGLEKTTGQTPQEFYEDYDIYGRTNYSMQDPSKARSYYSAAFDPDNLGNPNILGGAAPVAAGGILSALGGNDANAAYYRPADQSIADLAQRTIRQSYDPSPDVGSIEGVSNNPISQGANAAAFKVDRLNRNLQNAGILSLLAPESTPDVLGRAAYGESRWYDPALVLLDFL